jgi:WD40 repeat protein
MHGDALSTPNTGLTVRVFVSSTFRDMHAERDALNRMVFPELRRRCHTRGADCVGLDLRWGVTEEEIQREGTLAICLKEIEQSRPFFVCLLGERFGSTYLPDEVPVSLWEATRDEAELGALIERWYGLDDTVTPPVYRLRRERGRLHFDREATALVRFWEEHGLPSAGDSLTAHEVFRGVLEAAEPPDHAFCYLRAPGLTDDPVFPTAWGPLFVETEEIRRQKLAILKARVRDSNRVVVHDYSARYAGLRIDAALLPASLSSTDRAALDDGVVTPEEFSEASPTLRLALEQHGTVALAGMEQFAAQVIDDLWKVIEPLLERPVILDSHQAERAHHERFVRRHTDFFAGCEQKRRDVSTYLARKDDRAILVVTGEPGVGKSAFLAACVRDARDHHPDALVIPHFIGTAPDSASLPTTLRSLCETLRREAGLEETVADDVDKLRLQLRALLEQASARRQVILFLDALNQLDRAFRSHELDWLPHWAPPATRIVVSVQPGDCLELLTKRVPADHLLTLHPLPADERRVLIGAVLARRRKKLTPDQLDDFLDTRKRPDAALPLYTLVALEELCLFGDHEALSTRLASLPPSVPELFAQVLARLEHEHTRSLVQAVCVWLAASRGGLSEGEVLDLLSPNGAFPTLQWARVYRALEPYLKPIGQDSGDGPSGRLDFYHDQLRFAVFRRYFAMSEPTSEATEPYCSAHRQLAEYYLTKADPKLDSTWVGQNARAFDALPYHMLKSGQLDRCKRIFLQYRFIHSKIRLMGVSPLLADLEALKAAPVPTRDAFSMLEDALRLSTPRIRQDHQSVPSQLSGRLVQTGVADIETFVDSISPSFIWLRPLTRSLVQAGSPLLAEMPFHGRVGAVSSDCTRAVLMGDDAPLTLWDLDTQYPLRIVPLAREHEWVSIAPSCDFGFSRNQRSQSLQLWDLETGQIIIDDWRRDSSTAFGRPSEHPIIFSTDGTLFFSYTFDYSAGTGKLEAFQTRSGARIAELSSADASFTRAPRQVLLVDSGHTAIMEWENGPATIWDLTLRNGRARSLDISGRIAVCPSGCHVVALTSDPARQREHGKLKWMDVPTRVMREAEIEGMTLLCAANDIALLATDDFFRPSVVVFDLARGAQRISFSPDAALEHAVADHDLALANDGTLALWDLRSGARLSALCGPSSPVRGGASISIKRLCSSRNRAITAEARTLRVWRTDRRDVQGLGGHHGAVTGLLSAVRNEIVVSGGYDWHVKVWSARHAREVTTLKAPRGIRHLAISPDGHWVAAICEDAFCRVWDVTSRRVVGSLPMHGLDTTLYGVFGTTCELLVCTGDHIELISWQSRRQRPIVTLPGASPRTLTVTADGTAIVWCDGSSVYCWRRPSDVTKLLSLTSNTPPIMLAADAQLKRLAMLWSPAAGRGLEVWDLEMQRLATAITVEASDRSLLSLSPDGHYALVVTGATATLVAVEPPFETASFHADEAITAATFAGENNVVCVGDRGGCVHFLRVVRPTYVS